MSKRMQEQSLLAAAMLRYVAELRHSIRFYNDMAVLLPNRRGHYRVKAKKSLATACRWIRNARREIEAKSEETRFATADRVTERTLVLDQFRESVWMEDCLIAAAPDLYVALQTALHAIDDLTDKNMALDRGLAALAKARGEQ